MGRNRLEIEDLIRENEAAIEGYGDKQKACVVLIKNHLRQISDYLEYTELNSFFKNRWFELGENNRISLKKTVLSTISIFIKTIDDLVNVDNQAALETLRNNITSGLNGLFLPHLSNNNNINNEEFVPGYIKEAIPIEFVLDLLRENIQEIITTNKSMKELKVTLTGHKAELARYLIEEKEEEAKLKQQEKIELVTQQEEIELVTQQEEVIFKQQEEIEQANEQGGIELTKQCEQVKKEKVRKVSEERKLQTMKNNFMDRKNGLLKESSTVQIGVMLCSVMTVGFEENYYENCDKHEESVFEFKNKIDKLLKDITKAALENAALIGFMGEMKDAVEALQIRFNRDVNQELERLMLARLKNRFRELDDAIRNFSLLSRVDDENTAIDNRIETLRATIEMTKAKNISDSLGIKPKMIQDQFDKLDKIKNVFLYIKSKHEKLAKDNSVSNNIFFNEDTNIYKEMYKENLQEIIDKITRKINQKKSFLNKINIFLIDNQFKIDLLVDLKEKLSKADKNQTFPEFVASWKRLEACKRNKTRLKSFKQNKNKVLTGELNGAVIAVNRNFFSSKETDTEIFINDLVKKHKDFELNSWNKKLPQEARGFGNFTRC